MIAASDPQEYIPSGRQQTFRHPGPPQLPPKRNNCLFEDLLHDKFEKVSLKEKKESEWWMLRKAPVKPLRENWSNGAFQKHKTEFPEVSAYKTIGNSLNTTKHVDNFSKVSITEGNNTPLKKTSSTLSTLKSDVNFVEEELYFKGNSVVWSRGIDSTESIENKKKTVCSYTFPLPVQHAIWCTFECDRPIYETDLFPLDNYKQEGFSGVLVPAVCIVDSYNIHVFTQKGEDFVNDLPFQIGNIWNMKFGILLEQQLDSKSHNATLSEPKASLHSLSFPLDEICPVAVNMGSCIHILNNINLKIVFTSEDPSICLMYDGQTKQHSVYFLRKIHTNEKMELLNRMNCTYPSAASLSNKLKSRLSIWENVKNSNNLTVPSPINSRPGSVTSFCNQTHPSKAHSSMAAMSRCQSPALSSFGSPWLNKVHRLNASVPIGSHHYMPSSSSFCDQSRIASHFYTNPIICLEHLWTEPLVAQDDTMGCAASKVFLCDDFTNQWYLCYLSPIKCQLNLIEIDFSDQLNIKFGTTNSLYCKDAIPIPMLHMLAVLEHNGNVNLYSGLTPVGKLHIGGTLVQHTPSPYVRRNLSTFNSPFPRRSSLLPHCKPTDPKFDEHLLSPVLPETTNSSARSNVLQLNFQHENNLPKAVLNGLRDAVENRITLRYSDGTYYRLTLPPITSHPLVENCLNALKQCLSRDIVSVVLTKWYSARNALGSQDMNFQQEWELFETLLLELLGYEQTDINVNDDCPLTPLSNPKKLKPSTSGNDEDWLYLLNSHYHEELGFHVTTKFQLGCNKAEKTKLNHGGINTNALLFQSVKLILFGLHLLYEDLKLNILRCEDLKVLAKFLNKLSCDMGMEKFSLHYWKDFQDICRMESREVKFKEDVINSYQFIDEDPPSIMEFIYQIIQNQERKKYPFINCVNNRSRDIIQICETIFAKEHLIQTLELNLPFIEHTDLEFPAHIVKPAEKAIILMTRKKITVRDLDTLPPALYLLMYSTLWKCRDNPTPDLPIEAYYLLWRDELASQARKIQKKKVYNSNDKNEYETQISEFLPSSKSLDNEQQDGMEAVESPLIKLRFPDDMRVAESRKMLQSSKPVPIVLVQRPDVSDHDFIEEQEKHLYAICTRTMALSPGRGMFTLRTSSPVITEPLQTPQLCLTGKAPPRGSTVELNHIDTPSNMNLWPLFHNGVASGLRITPDAHNIDNTWITFNKPKGPVEQQMEHAGFLMALGLNGHLKNLHVLNTYDYLSKLHEMTSIGVLLGLSAAYRGTSDMSMTKTLSIHVEALLPPTSMELDVHQNVQVAGLLGIGLVYQETCHRHIIEVLLSEIGRPPGPEMENSIDRESYSLAAGLSLGLVTLRQGSCSLGLSDLNIPDRLHYYMVGGKRRALTGAQKDKYKVSSFQIREGSCVNLDVTAPGATIALGLMYLASGNKAVADWMAPPETQYLLDFVRPDFLMFRILARSLILWNDIVPSKEWIESQVPDTIRPYCMVKPSHDTDIDYEAMNQAYCNIVTGACFALGLKFAGSADEDAFETLLHFCHLFTNLTVKSIAELAGKPTVETCLNVLLLSAAMVMSGTGNIEIMRLVRHLRRRIGVASSAVVTYGSHLALHMALGLLFLGGGRYTLSNSPANVAALICAFYPKFPTHSNDNRYHLQAFRHLYVLAVEPRLLIPRDVHTGKSCYATLKVIKLDGSSSFVKGPGIIPALETLREVRVEDERYWPVIFKKGQNWDILKVVLSSNGFIEVKQRAGCLSYIVDKLGFHSHLARTLTQSEIVSWDPPVSTIVSFTNDSAIKLFCDQFLVTGNDQFSATEQRIKKTLTKITYEAVVKDKLIIVPVISFLLKMVHNGLSNTMNSVDIWQVKLISAQILSTDVSRNLLSVEAMMAIEQQIVEVFESWEDGLREFLQAYLRGNALIFEEDTLRRLAKYVIFYDIPYREEPFAHIFLEIIQNEKRSPLRTLRKLVKLKSV